MIKQKTKPYAKQKMKRFKPTQLNIRKYQKKDHEACMEIIKSNTPKFFSTEETPPEPHAKCGQRAGRTPRAGR